MTNTETTLNLLVEGKTPKLLSLIPKGHSPKLYLDLIKTQIMGVDSQGKARPDDDTLLFLYVAKRTGLDPLTKQVYAIYRWDGRMGREKMTIQASIDGMRLVAQRTNGYVGQDDVIYDDESKKYPGKATVTVYKSMGGQRVPFTASARWNEYCQTDKAGLPTSMWAKMPYLMLGKCAEALALRKAFPNELSGIYTPEELSQTQSPLGELVAPTRFEKKEPEVVNNQVATESTKSDLNAPIQLPEVNDVEKTEAPRVVLGTTTKPSTQDVAAMRAALKPKTFEELKEDVKNMGFSQQTVANDPKVIGPQ